MQDFLATPFFLIARWMLIIAAIIAGRELIRVIATDDTHMFLLSGPNGFDEDFINQFLDNDEDY